MTVSVAGTHLDDRGRGAADDDSPRPDVPPHLDRPAPAIEKDDVDGKAHAEGMNRATARKQKRAAIGRTPSPGEPAQPDPERIRNHNPHPEESRTRATLVPAPT